MTYVHGNFFTKGYLTSNKSYEILCKSPIQFQTFSNERRNEVACTRQIFLVAYLILREDDPDIRPYPIARVVSGFCRERYEALSTDRLRETQLYRDTRLDCEQYVRCHRGEGLVDSCPKGLHIDLSTRVCTLPCSSTGSLYTDLVDSPFVLQNIITIGLMHYRMKEKNWFRSI